MTTVHHSHQPFVLRLKRAGGHLNKVIEMMEKQEGCVDIARQLQAVSNAVINAKKEFIKEHINHCLGNQAPGDTGIQESIAELKEIAKYL
jgi:DNA-binding FrmR family transcriptional regulator